jgi:hypothetical protein
VVKGFVAEVKVKALGLDVSQSLDPGQQFRLRLPSWRPWPRKWTPTAFRRLPINGRLISSMLADLPEQAL